MVPVPTIHIGNTPQPVPTIAPNYTVQTPGGSTLPGFIALPVVQAGQTRWNVGLSEPRRTLYVNGIRATRNVDYTINLPFVDWIAPVPLDTGDELTLTF